MSVNTKVILLTSLFLLSLLPLSTTSDDETEDEHGFDYLGYSSKGPKHWGELNASWANCSTGKMQSPIDINCEMTDPHPYLGRLVRDYRPARATLTNRGHDIMLKWKGDAGGININGTVYNLEQCHWHSPSEHTFNGLRHQLELHMVHESKEKKVAVVAATYDFGQPDPFLAKLIPKIKPLGSAGEELGTVDPRELRLGLKRYYRYIGSLTVPPCNEGVIWTIAKKVGTVSMEQVEALRDAVHDGFEQNARPVQAGEERPVFYYAPMF